MKLRCSHFEDCCTKWECDKSRCTTEVLFGVLTFEMPFLQPSVVCGSCLRSACVLPGGMNREQSAESFAFCCIC